MIDWLNLTFSGFDRTLLEFFHNLALNYGNILTPISKVIAVTTDLPLLLIGWLGFVLFFVKKDKRCGMSMCGACIIGAIFTTIIIKNLVYRTRPYLASDLYRSWWEMFKMRLEPDTSFPSGHTCAAMAGVTAYFIWSKNKKVSWLVFLYPLIVGASRIYLCVHYPSDVLAGLVVGCVSAPISNIFVNLFYMIFNKYPDFFFCKYCLTEESKR